MAETKPIRGIGPAIFVTAAFIGPGTVLTASKAGAEFGYGLLWAVGFSVVAAIVLQEMAARLGIVSGKGLAEAIHTSVRLPILRWILLILVLGGILFGNAAYQTGNILGAASGLEILTLGSEPVLSESGFVFGSQLMWSAVIAMVALSIIWIGRFELLQICLVALVGIMGVLFLVSAIAIGPNWGEAASGLIPQLPKATEPSSTSQLWLVIGLIGTTVVPYNLFLHASGAATRWAHTTNVPKSVRQSVWDTVISVSIGGMITASLLVTACVAFPGGQNIKNIGDIAAQLRPALGEWAEFAFAIGIFSAGLTSSITAPIAAGYATAGCFGKEAKLSNPFLKWVATGVVVAGLACAAWMGSTPSQAIIGAQVANGLLLPVIAIFLLVMVNRVPLMHAMVNGWVRNLLGIVVIGVTLLMAARQFNSVVTKLGTLWDW